MGVGTRGLAQAVKWLLHTGKNLCWCTHVKTGLGKMSPRTPQRKRDGCSRLVSGPRRTEELKVPWGTRSQRIRRRVIEEVTQHRHLASTHTVRTHMSNYTHVKSYFFLGRSLKASLLGSICTTSWQTNTRISGLCQGEDLQGEERTFARGFF